MIVCPRAAGLPGASESCWCAPRFAHRNGTGVPASFMVTILRCVSHGVGTAAVTSSCASSCAAAFHAWATISKVTGSIWSLGQAAAPVGVEAGLIDVIQGRPEIDVLEAYPCAHPRLVGDLGENLADAQFDFVGRLRVDEASSAVDGGMP